jgi:hypothetical protein
MILFIRFIILFEFCLLNQVYCQDSVYYFRDKVFIERRNSRLILDTSLYKTYGTILHKIKFSAKDVLKFKFCDNCGLKYGELGLKLDTIEQLPENIYNYNGEYVIIDEIKMQYPYNYRNFVIKVTCCEYNMKNTFILLAIKNIRKRLYTVTYLYDEL